MFRRNSLRSHPPRLLSGGAIWHGDRPVLPVLPLNIRWGNVFGSPQLTLLLLSQSPAYIFVLVISLLSLCLFSALCISHQLRNQCHLFLTRYPSKKEKIMDSMVRDIRSSKIDYGAQDCPTDAQEQHNTMYSLRTIMLPYLL